MTDRSPTKHLVTLEELRAASPDDGRDPRTGIYASMPEADYNRLWLGRVARKTVESPNGCWLWQGFILPKGYGGTTYRSRNTSVHRQVYKLFVKADLVTEDFVCHTCDVRHCWNPNHLFLGTAKINNNDCAAKGRHHNAVKTHCPKGHEFSPDNTYTTKDGLRQCRACARLKGRERWKNHSTEARERIRAQRRAYRSAQRNIA